MKICFRRFFCRTPALIGASFLVPNAVSRGAEDLHSVLIAPIYITDDRPSSHSEDGAATLTAVSGEFLQRFDLHGAAELSPFVPGLFVSQQSPDTPTFNLRGITSDSPDPRQPARLSVFLNGVSLNASQAASLKWFDLEGVDVVKGPQGLLFGGDAEIGAISVRTRRAEARSDAEATVGIGDGRARLAMGYVNEPLSPSWSARFAVFSRHRDGAVQNLAGGPDLGSDDSTAFRLSVARIAPRGTRIDFVVDGEYDAPTGTPFKSGIVPTTRGDTDPYLPAELNRASALRVRRTAGGATIISETECTSQVHLHTVLTARAFDAFEAFDADGSRYYLLEPAEDTQGHQWSAEARLEVELSPALRASIGISGQVDKTTERVTLTTDERQLWPFLSGQFRDGLVRAGIPASFANAAIPAMSPFVPQPSLPSTFALFRQSSLPSSLQALALLAAAPLKAYQEEHYINGSNNERLDTFANAIFSPWKRVKFSGGARLTHERTRSSYEVINSSTPGTLGFILGATPNDGFAPTNGIKRGETSSNGVSGRAAAQIDWNGKFSSYVSAARGRRSPALIIDASSTRRLREETVDSFELGSRASIFGDRLRLSGAGFTYRYRHFQSIVADPLVFGRFSPVDAGSATGRGVEISVEGRVSEVVGLIASWGNTDATFDGNGVNGSRQQYAGNRLRLTSRNTATSGFLFEPSHVAHGGVFLYAWAEYRSSYYFDDDNGLFAGALRQPGYTLIHARAGWYTASHSWELIISARNLFDRNFLSDAGNIGASFGLPTYVRGEPRREEISLTRHF